MFTVIFLIIIGVSVSVIAFIVIRKFPQLVNLDVDGLPEEKIAKKKREIIGKRLEARASKAKTKLEKYLKPLVKKSWGILQLRFRIYVGKIERLLYHEQVVKEQKAAQELAPEERIQKIESIIRDAEHFLKNNVLDRAEELFLNAIKIDMRSASAYRGLGDVYFAKNSLEEARETYRVVLQIEPDDDSTVVKLADIAESQGDLEEAIQYYERAVLINDSLSPRFYHLSEMLLRVGQPKVAREAILQAVELEPQNPKYLDLLIETAILCNDKTLAESGYNELRLVNPDNQKLLDFQDRINKI